MKNKIVKFLNILIALYRVLRLSKFNLHLNSVSDESSCYILGTGPSLKSDLENNLEFLKKQNIVVVNHFDKSDFYAILKPKYYVFADPNFWLNTGLPLNKEAEDLSLSTLHNIRDTTDWDLVILIPFAAKDFFDKIFIDVKCIKLVYYNTTVLPIDGLESLNHYLYKSNLAVPRVQNVLIAAIYTSINIGFSEINLLGTDHSWTQDLIVNNENKVGTIDHHFYDKEVPEFRLYVHCDGIEYNMHKLLRDFAYMFEGYFLLRNYADYRGVRIYNRCKVSFIDAFERKKIQ